MEWQYQWVCMQWCIGVFVSHGGLQWIHNPPDQSPYTLTFLTPTALSLDNTVTMQMMINSLSNNGSCSSNNLTPNYTVITGVYHSAVKAEMGQSGEGVNTCHNTLHLFSPLFAIQAGPTSGIEYDKCIRYLDILFCSRLLTPQRTLKDTFIHRCSSQSDFHLLLFEIDFIQVLDGGSTRLSGLSVRQLRCKTEHPIDPFCSFMALYKDCSIVITLFHFWYQIKLVGYISIFGADLGFKRIQTEHKTKKQFEYLQSQLLKADLCQEAQTELWLKSSHQFIPHPEEW